MRWGKLHLRKTAAALGVALSCPGLAIVAPLQARALGTIAIGVDPAVGDTLIYPYFCRGYGQVFMAEDTLIESISVWRPAQPDSDAVPRYLFVTETLESGGVIGPDVRYEHRLWEGPGLVNWIGDGVHPVEYRFVFDPPLALPRPGSYFLDILAPDYFIFPILAASGDQYPDGGVWKTGPNFDCTPGSAFLQQADLDLAFTVVFQRDNPTVDVPDVGSATLTLLPPRPNPIRTTTTIPFNLPSSARVTAAVFDLAGHKVRQLAFGTEYSPGMHRLTWDGRDAQGAVVPTGIYFERVSAAGRSLSRRIAAIR